MLLADQDYHAITLDRVAKAVGVAKTGILWHFDSKEGLLVAAVLDMFEELENAIVVEKSSLPTLNVRVARVRPFSRRGDRRKLADLLSSDELTGARVT